MAVVLTEQDKARARYHMGYLQVQEAATFSLGVPAGVQTQFMIEGAFHKILESALPKFAQLLDQLDCIECEVFGGVDTATITKIAEIEIDPKRLEKLAQYYRIAQASLGNLMGIVPNPWDQREWLNKARGCINVPVG